MDLTENIGFIFLLIVISLIGIFFIFTPKFLLNHNNKYYLPTNEEKNNITIYLNNLGVTYYYRIDCIYCEEQKKYINFSLWEHKINTQFNSNPLVYGTPTFEFNGEYISGLQTYNQLKENYGYET